MSLSTEILGFDLNGGFDGLGTNTPRGGWKGEDGKPRATAAWEAAAARIRSQRRTVDLPSKEKK